MTTELDVERVVKDAIAAVHKKHPDRSAADVEAVVREELNKLVDRPVQDYLSVLTERAAKQRFKGDTQAADN